MERKRHEKTNHMDLAHEYAELIRAFTYLTRLSADGSFMLPQIVIPRLMPRGPDDVESFVNEAKKIPFYREKDGIRSGILPVASAHTPLEVSQWDIQQAIHSVSGEEVTDFQYPDNMAAQLTAYVWGEKGKNIRTLDIAQMSPVERWPYILAMLEQTENMTRVLAEAGYVGITDKMDEKIKLYMVFGNSTEQERRQYLLAPAVQTIGAFHMHATYFPDWLKDRVNYTAVSEDDYLKQLGPMDTLWHKHFDIEVINQIRNIAAEMGNPHVRVSSLVDHAVRPDNKGVANFEGYTIKYAEPVVAAFAYEMAFRTMDWYNDIHNVCMNAFEEYYKKAGDGLGQEAVRKELTDALRGLGFNLKASKLADFVFSNRPTYGQIVTWLDEDTTTSTIAAESRKNLENMRRKYEIRHNNFKDPQYYQKMVNNVMKVYGTTPNEAKLLLRIMEEPYLPSADYKRVKFNVPRHPSGSVIFSKYNVSDTLWVEEMIIATRQEKGVVEDLIDANVSRDKGIS